MESDDSVATVERLEQKCDALERANESLLDDMGFTRLNIYRIFRAAGLIDNQHYQTEADRTDEVIRMLGTLAGLERVIDALAK